MRHEHLAPVLPAFRSSGWSSWAPEISESAEPASAAAPAFWLGSAATLLMWGFASLLAVWYW